jgi:hypothetical protein
MLILHQTSEIIIRYTYLETYQRTVNSTSDYTLWALYRSYSNGISANIEL